MAYNDLKYANFTILTDSDEYCEFMIFPNAHLKTIGNSDVFTVFRSWRFLECGTATFKNYKFSPPQF